MGIRRAFTLIEIVVILAVLVILAAIVTPNVVGILDKERVAAAAESLDNIVVAIDAFERDVNEPPRFLTQLQDSLVVGDQDACGGTYSSGERADWAGPYLTRNVAPTGVPVAIGTVNNQVTDIAGINKLVLLIPGVTEEDAISLNKLVDDDGDNRTGGTVRWTVPDVNGLVTVTYLTGENDC